ncbi:MAG: hypothetical protein KJ614_17860 [Gammaproteobacteria bacterium]|uniref:hypothetical protein n=1 Tax=Rhodoferax sp. TaxID=50421 RepID=UPI0017C2BB55|nr:hypothetical protein [Rhodoferax sp.]MBU3900754.1 hypothetical protein [Gammaproteobacteria bacterium]MBA3056701.1 hypothetical protein [Rhodoferax sp.]MBU4079505.1 hypothetical protein [Gammaproteobacteria bacterium]MBU4114787.1 hypothetical protein [Gammaproteobacteria bacterium]MBU4170542.1 hypothetical protein [Gammaproteobacteria bacterium]
MKSLAKYILITAILSLVAFSAHAVQIRAAMSCSNWQAGKTDSKLDVGGKAWVLGFLSGVSFNSNKDILLGIPSATIFRLVDNYCQSNPQSTTNAAAEDIYYQIIKMKGL